MADVAEKKVKEKRPIDILRERHGGMSKELQEYFKEQNKIRKALKDALSKGPRSVPDLARACELPADKVLWHVMAMKKYGEVEEAGHQGDYLTFARKEA